MRHLDLIRALKDMDHGELSLIGKVEEHVIWQRDVESLLVGVPDNVRRICEHGFTEMLNNAIEHSGGTQVRYLVEQEHGTIHFLIQDDGIGIFEKVRSYFGLEDHRQAILELSKGKLTTDTSRHSGEGIFFTSRMFDRFLIGSNNLGFSHRTGEDDWLIEAESFEPGYAGLDGDRRRIPRGQPRRSSTCSPDPRPTTTVSPGRTCLLDSQNSARAGWCRDSEAKRVLARFEGFKEVRLDFEGIDSIGQAFADEIFRVFKLAHPEIEVVAVRASEAVEQMIKRAQSQKPEPDTVPLVIPTARDLLEEIRTGKESRAIIPVPARKKLASGDRVTFAEAAFDRIGIPSLITDGDTISVTLTKADETGDSYGTMRLVAIGWGPLVTPEPLRFLIFPVSRGEPRRRRKRSGTVPGVCSGRVGDRIRRVGETHRRPSLAGGFHPPYRANRPPGRESRSENGRRTSCSRGCRLKGVGPGVRERARLPLNATPPSSVSTGA